MTCISGKSNLEDASQGPTPRPKINFLPKAGRRHEGKTTRRSVRRGARPIRAATCSMLRRTPTRRGPYWTTDAPADGAQSRPGRADVGRRACRGAVSPRAGIAPHSTTSPRAFCPWRAESFVIRQSDAVSRLAGANSMAYPSATHSTSPILGESTLSNTVAERRHGAGSLSGRVRVAFVHRRGGKGPRWL